MIKDYFGFEVNEGDAVTYVQPRRRLQYNLRDGDVEKIEGNSLHIRSRETNKVVTRVGSEVILLTEPTC